MFLSDKSILVSLFPPPFFEGRFERVRRGGGCAAHLREEEETILQVNRDKSSISAFFFFLKELQTPFSDFMIGVLVSCERGFFVYLCTTLFAFLSVP